MDTKSGKETIVRPEQASIPASEACPGPTNYCFFATLRIWFLQETVDP